MINGNEQYALSLDLKYIEQAIALKDYSGTAYCTIPKIMPLLNQTIKKEKKYYNNISCLDNKDTSEFHTSSYTSCNYIPLHVGEDGYKGDTFDIAFISGNINNIKLL